jgi:hypothetical protein
MSYIETRKGLFEEICKYYKISEKEAEEYEKEILEEINKQFNKDFKDIATYNYSTQLGMGLFIRNLGRTLSAEKEKDKKTLFVSVFFIPIFYLLIKGTPKEKDLIANIDTIECKTPRIWTSRNTVSCLLTQETMFNKIKQLEEKNKELCKYFSTGYVDNIDIYGNGILLPVYFNQKEKEQIKGKFATFNGLSIALISKINDKIKWNWNIGKERTSLDINVIKSGVPEKFHVAEVTMDSGEFYCLCTVLAMIFNLDHIDMFDFEDKEEIGPRILMGMRNIEYKK